MRCSLCGAEIAHHAAAITLELTANQRPLYRGTVCADCVIAEEKRLHEREAWARATIRKLEVDQSAV